MFYAWNPRPFPVEVQPKRIFAAEDSVGVVAEDGKIWFVNEKLKELLAQVGIGVSSNGIGSSCSQWSRLSLDKSPGRFCLRAMFY